MSIVASKLQKKREGKKMVTLEQMKENIALTMNERAIKNREHRIFKAIFKGQDGTPCDCETCQYARECELDNPESDANYCKVS